MNVNEVKQLLDLFYDGCTTKEQEQLLKTYFNSDHVAEELLIEKETFLEFFVSERIDVPLEFTHRVEQWMNEKVESEHRQQEVKKRLINNAFFMSIAAAVLILLFSLPFIQTYKPVSSLTPEDRIALAEAKDAIQLVSKKWNKGMKQVGEIPQTIDKSNKMLKRIINKKKNHE